MKSLKTFLSVILIVLSSCANEQQPVGKLQLGSELFFKVYLEELSDKEVALVVNKSSVLPDGKHLLDEMIDRGLKPKVIFTPEHGFEIDKPAGEEIKSLSDSIKGIKIISLYGDVKEPTDEMLKGIEFIVYDLQDVGVRCYTYISTLFYIMKSASRNHIPVMILDRPVPINGEILEGPVLQPEFRSFTGIAPVPMRYAMTSAELAKFYSEEGMFDQVSWIIILTLKGWNRDSFYDDYDLPWIPPSPNITDIETAIMYSGMNLIEGTNISEGRGTERPFLTAGAPFIDKTELVNELRKTKPEGIEFEPVTFTPKSIPGKVTSPKYQDKECQGISVRITDRKKARPVTFTLQLISALIKLYPKSFRFTDSFDLLAGNSTLKKDLLANKPVDKIIAGWQREIEEFNKKRSKYLMY